MPDWPSVDVVIPTRNRPQLLRAAIRSVCAQDYPGRLGVLVVYDGTAPDPALSADDAVPVRVMVNQRAPGLAGTRNTGIMFSDAVLVAFCDDDDTWLPGKLRAQIAALQADPDADLATTAMRVDFGDHATVRRAGTGRVSHAALVRSRMSMLHSSSFLVRRSALVGGLGLVDERAPGGHNEDWDLLLRASARHDIVHVDEPLIAVRWGSTSMFASAWQERVDSLEWMMRRHPELTKDATGHARLLGQIAFGYASLGHRRRAVHVALRGIRRRAREPRSYLALLVASSIMSSSRVLDLLHRRGHGV